MASHGIRGLYTVHYRSSVHPLTRASSGGDYDGVCRSSHRRQRRPATCPESWNKAQYPARRPSSAQRRPQFRSPCRLRRCNRRCTIRGVGALMGRLACKMHTDSQRCRAVSTSGCKNFGMPRHAVSATARIGRIQTEIGKRAGPVHTWAHSYDLTVHLGC